jgi:hypothetical protein
MQMSIKEITKFGIPRKVFKGCGFARLSNGNEVTAQFTLVQLIDAQLVFFADIQHPIWDFLTERLQVNSLSGQLSDGRLVNIDGLFLKETKQKSRNKTRLIGYSSHWVLGEPAFSESTSICFELVNFLFRGTETELIIDNDKQDFRWSIMTLNLGDRAITLRQISNYDQVVATLQSQHGIQITCTATTTIKDASELAETITIIDTLCDVISVARGTLISWTSYDVNTPENGLSQSRYRDSVTRRFVGIELIHRSNGRHTKEFLERSFSRCQELEPGFAIRRIARAFTETRDGPFIESRSLLIGVLTEYLASVQARLDNRTYFLNNDLFNSRWNIFKIEATTALTATYPEITPKHLPAMLGNMRGLNRRPFSWKLNNLAKWLDIKFDQGEIERFVEIRNKLAHEGRFPETGTPSEHYKKMQHIMDRLMLRLLDYHGPYYDFEHREIRQI